MGFMGRDKDEEEDIIVTVKKMHVTYPKTKSKRKNKKSTTATTASVSALIQEAFMKRSTLLLSLLTELPSSSKRPREVSHKASMTMGYRGNGISLTRQEVEKISNITLHSALWQ